WRRLRRSTTRSGPDSQTRKQSLYMCVVRQSPAAMADTATWDLVIVAPHPVAYHRVINRALRLSRRGLTGKNSVGTNPCAVPRTRARFYEAGFTAVNQIEKHGTHKS